MFYVPKRVPEGMTGRRTSAGTGAVMEFFKSRKPARKKSASSRLFPAKTVVSTVHGTRTVLMDTRSGRYLTLDDVASRIWSLFSHGLAVSEVIDMLLEEYSATRAQLEQDVEQFVGELVRLRLVEVA